MTLKQFENKPALMQSNGILRCASDLDLSLQMKLMETVEAYYQAYSSIGYHRKDYSSPASIKKVKKISAEKAISIIETLRLEMKWLDHALGSEEENSLQLRHLKRALDHYGLEADSDFLSTIQEDSVIEIYTQDMVQIYRNMNLLEITGYSILDLSVFEWWVLWERPQFANQQIYKVVIDVFMNEKSAVPYNINSHVLKESFNAGMTEPFISRSCVVEMQHLVFLKPLRKDSPRAIISTIYGQLLAEGIEETFNLKIL